MPVTAPGAKYAFQLGNQFNHKPMDKEPLRNILINSNWLWKYHRPPLVSCAFVQDAIAADRVFFIPILPSQDGTPGSTTGIKYRFTFSLYAGAIGNVGVTIEWGTTVAGAFTLIDGPTNAALVNGQSFYTLATDKAIDNRATLLKITFTYSAIAYRPAHLLVWPQPSAMIAGIQSSGFIPFDDTLISATGAPINTEMLDRCPTNAIAVITDRWQLVANFAQATTRGNAKYGVTVAKSAMAKFKPQIPVDDENLYELEVRAIASVSGGTTADRLQIQTPYAVLKLAADGTLVSGTVNCKGKLPELLALLTADGANTTYLHSLAIYWRPQGKMIANDSICNGIISPVAKTTLLLGANSAVAQAALRSYVMPSHCAEANISGGADRCKFHAVIPPNGQLHGQFWALRASLSFTVGAQSDSSFSTASDASPASIAKSATTGTECFVHQGASDWVTGGEKNDDGTAASESRLLQLTAALAPATEVCEVFQCVGWTLALHDKTLDLSTL